MAVSTSTGPCAQERQRLGTEMPGKFVPQCTASGKYQPKQCYGSTGYCWCVDPETGKELPGTRVAPGRGEVTCTPAAFATSFGSVETCSEARQRAGPMIPGKYIPQCTPSGDYQQKQCHGSTGFCWCVDPKTGKELPGTRVGPGKGEVQCSSINFAAPIFVSLGSCAEARQRAGPMMPGKYIPQCTSSGKYEPVQCHGSTGNCWCVNTETGEEISGTRVGPGAGRRPSCPSTAFAASSFVSMETCAQARQRVGPMMPGKYIPQCVASGDYNEVQCHGSTGYCWCVNPKTGEKVPNTEVAPGHGPPSCHVAAFAMDAPMPKGPCTLEREHAGPAMPGKFIPKCTPSGKYLPKQCSPTGFCWCVEIETGKEIAGTRVAPGDNRDPPCYLV